MLAGPGVSKATHVVSIQKVIVAQRAALTAGQELFFLRCSEGSRGSWHFCGRWCGASVEMESKYLFQTLPDAEVVVLFSSGLLN